MSAAAPPSGPVTLAEARWPEPDDQQPPRIPGFIVSPFNPLVAAVADRCLRAAHGTPQTADPRRLERTAIVLASADGDTATADAVGRAVADGSRVQPLLFFQSNPNAVAGHVAARWGLRGPVSCVRTADADALPAALAAAELLLLDGDATEVLVIAADAAAGTPGEARARLLAPAPHPVPPRLTAPPKGNPHP
ncbi:beta-ketoacyl synthase N-terminal-like domain-containing protein [Streptomyces sp. SL13]|uniref:Beta-ketoacyl synthase N-terminal-like domain-containing protein n=1 Tax=Streptantibioticus silvisoli TaxID=2705255 RepID=A0AA90H5J5_9ACTN|nr:beta-ketoacyl synthase N-terminal-like domain-containing protein [Streptantibioticus silvisoli]MDI5971044.1 beta-ketoacyl synthase N-terminal-like domain-containing protein [Streptantibioticus silvisoli]